MRVLVADVGVAGIQLQSSFELALRSGEIPVVVQLCQRQGPVPCGQALIFLQCQCCNFLNLAPSFIGCDIAEIAFVVIGPEMPVISGANQLGSYAYTIA